MNPKLTEKNKLYKKFIKEDYFTDALYIKIEITKANKNPVMKR